MKHVAKLMASHQHLNSYKLINTVSPKIIQIFLSILLLYEMIFAQILALVFKQRIAVLLIIQCIYLI